ncbi:MAG TPA: MG2 domain-containing protein [Chitinophagaceae bacterium]|nr:MG2 domain-containing protein [Chitinophagaceae bacterium]
MKIIHLPGRLVAALLLILCNQALYAQQKNDYVAQWKKIDELVSKGLPKSAIAEVDKIYTSAKKENSDAQVIKALLYQMTLNQNAEEDVAEKNIGKMEAEIATAKEPSKSILESIIAQLYRNYFQQNRYKLYNRTSTVNFDKKDIATWTAEDLNKKIGELYLASISEKKLLQQTKLEPFDAIIFKGNARYLRPTLYDLLTHRALEYFETDEPDVTRPYYAFEIKDEDAFAPAEKFMQHPFTTQDSASLHYKALLVFRELLAFHLNDAKPDALIDADIERINFVYQYAVINNKDSLYIDALNAIATRFSDNSASAQAAFLAVQQIYNNASQNAENKTNSNGYTIKEAKQLLDKIAQRFPESEGGSNAKNLLLQILHPSLNLTTEKVNVPELPFRTLLSYKNIATVHFRIVKLSAGLKKALPAYDNDKLFRQLTAAKNIREWAQALPVTDDYLQHSAEVKVAALPAGEYVLLGSAAADFNLDKNPLAAVYFCVSNISFINSSNEYFILNRTTGQPLDGAKADVYKQVYDYKKQGNILKLLQTATADKHGYFKIPEAKDNESGTVLLDISYQNDRLFLDDAQYSYNYYRENDEEDDYDNQKDYDGDNAKVFLFTDRSIYRPGQTIYFKGIGVTKNWKTKKSMLLQTKDSITVYLNDASNQKSDSLKIVLNDFGSFNGTFRLPENKLNGEFEIDVPDYNNSSASFSVEEYKRPKFYTEFDKVKGSYRVGDTVSITGSAKAYAGNNVEGARVVYTVERTTRFIYPWLFWKIGYPRSNDMEITHGETITDANGKFFIKFPAIPDLSLDAAASPVFDYKVAADITDINGETRSADITVPVGYKALNLKVSLLPGEVMPADSLKYFYVSTKNLSDEFEPAKVNVKIYRLQPPQRLIRERYWSQPDTFVMTKEEYIQYFPNDEYKNELEKETWPAGETVFSTTDSTHATGRWSLGNKHFTQGWYRIEATAKDKYGQEVKDVEYFQLYDMNAPSLPAPEYIWNTVVKNYAESREQSSIIVGTSAKDIFLIQQLQRGDIFKQNQASSDFDFLTINNEKKSFDFKITEEDRGGFGINDFFVKDNRFYTVNNNIVVPWSNKDLNISFDTYRDKTTPGSREQWKVTISGNKGNKIAAEMLASMYDASLDQFKPHSWNALDVWPTNHFYDSWAYNQNFNSNNSFEKYWSEKYTVQKEKSYDRLNYLPEENFNIRIRGMASYNSPGLLQGKASGVQVEGSAALNEVVVTGYSSKKNLTGAINKVQFTPPKIVKDEEIMATDSTQFSTEQKTESPNPSQIQIRKNFNETAFFYPDLRTDKDGNISFSFTMPEALTQWKLMTFAHTKDLASGYAERTVVTQKDLMVQPNPPRFLREADTMEFSAKIVNLTDKPVRGTAAFHLLNASTMNTVDSLFDNLLTDKDFSLEANQSSLVTFRIAVPNNFNNAVVYRIVAKALSFGGGLEGASDGEEAAIPVVTNRMLVTESMPLPMRGDGVKNFSFEKLLHSSSSSTLSSYDITVEYTPDPAWYAVQALPYLMEFPHECAEQTFNRYYANAIATKIVSSSPRIEEIFQKWATADTSALLSNLQKNEELKSVLLQETPWVLQAQNEEAQKKNIAMLFDLAKMSLQLRSALDKLTDMQSPNGGFVWFKGGPDDRYITQYIVTGIGHLKKLGALPAFEQNDMKNILDKAIPYLDKLMQKDYDDLLKYKSKPDENHLSYIIDQYLYMRSFFPEYPIEKTVQASYTYFREQAKKYWLSQGKYMQAMIALFLYRSGDKTTAQAIMKSLKENAINNEELGMYWKEWNTGGYRWYQAPIESQAIMIEAFSETGNDAKTIDDLRTWLLKNKQTNDWKTTKATAEACYALLLQGTDGLYQEKTVSIQLGDTIIYNRENAEAGTGYFKARINGNDVQPAMGNIRVSVSSPINQSTNQPINNLPSWGAVYWQYFENLDKITFSETPLKLSKKLFIEKNTDTGPVLQPVNDGDVLHVGDKIKVRIELRADRDMEYVHMKDMRASCMEPANVLSEYKYQDGLGYYESTKDVSTNFFFGYLPKGTYVFEYPMFVTHGGNFSNGITTIQCMYAPEFTAHSEGVRVVVK